MKLSPHFALAEFNCHDGTPVPRSAEGPLGVLCQTILEPLRSAFGVVIVHSGYRHAAYNASIGGARRSFHIYDLRGGQWPAADVECRRGSVRDWWRFVDHIQRTARPPHGGLGYYPQGHFIHVDMRPGLSRWNGS